MSGCMYLLDFIMEQLIVFWVAPTKQFPLIWNWYYISWSYATTTDFTHIQYVVDYIGSNSNQWKWATNSASHNFIYKYLYRVLTHVINLHFSNKNGHIYSNPKNIHIPSTLFAVFSLILMFTCCRYIYVVSKLIIYRQKYAQELFIFIVQSV